MLAGEHPTPMDVGIVHKKVEEVENFIYPGRPINKSGGQWPWTELLDWKSSGGFQTAEENIKRVEILQLKCCVHTALHLQNLVT